jgi:ComF family protein
MGDLLAPTEFRSPGLGWIASGGYFAPPLSNAVRALKYRRLGAVAPILAGGIKEALPPLAPGTCIVPVPAHPSRVAERGIDHTAKLAEALSHQTGLLVASRRLIRVRATASQTGLSRELRRQNLLGAFDVVGALPSDTCLLVDDVLTTGSTALACSRALFAAGIQRVDLCVASTADRWLDPPKMTSASTFLP